MGVPVTIEAGLGERNKEISFYARSTHPEFVLPEQVYPVEHLVEADRVQGDCSISNKPCAHILPEVWDGGGGVRQNILEAQGM